MAACYAETRVGRNRVAEGGRLHRLHQADGSALPVGPLTSQRPAVSMGHASVPRAGSTRGHVKFSAGAFSVHWVLLIPSP